MIESALHFHRTKNSHWKSKSTNFQVFLEHDKRSDLSDLPLVPDCQTILTFFVFIFGKGNN